jgi:predicted amidohydrolase
VQCTAGPDRAANLAAAAPLVVDAAAVADLVVLPELFSLLGPADAMRAGQEDLGGPTVRWAADRARQGAAWMVAGSISEAGGPDGRAYNTAVLLDPSGRVAATYRKIHLFDNEVAGAAFQESATVAPGDEVVVADIGGGEGSTAPGVRLGLATCYDLRFPELFRILALRGAQVIVVPAAFTAVTGAAHWEVLLRARAIENQCYVVAAGQWGRTGAGIECFGHSMIVDPWGEVLGCLEQGDGVVTATLELDRVTEVRARLPSLANRRPETYRW